MRAFLMRACALDTHTRDLIACRSSIIALKCCSFSIISKVSFCCVIEILEYIGNIKKQTNMKIFISAIIYANMIEDI